VIGPALSPDDRYAIIEYLKSRKARICKGWSRVRFQSYAVEFEGWVVFSLKRSGPGLEFLKSI
jgi:hypothetical protein